MNSGQIITLWPARRVLRSFVQYLIVFFSRPEATSDVVSGMLVRPIVPNKHAKFGGSHLTILERSDPKPSEVAFSTFFS